MGKARPPPTNVAYVQDCDDDTGSVLEGSVPQYARSVAPGSPRKQQPNTSKSRRESRQYSETDSSDSTAHPTASKKKSKGKPRDDKRSGPVVMTKQRPSVRSSKTTPAPSSRASDESSYYAMPHQAASIRPRAHTRPESYYGQSAPRAPPPPLSSSPYYHQPLPNMVPPSFPPPSWAVSGPPPPMHGPMSAHPHPPPADLYHRDHRDLSLRFRPQSAMGFHQSSNQYDYDHVSEKSIPRRSSVSRKISKENKEQEDRKRMPPPPRPKSTRPERAPASERIVLRGQVPSSKRRSIPNFDEEDLEDGRLHPTALRRESGVEYGSTPFKNRRQSFGPSEPFFDYDEDEYEEPTPKPRSRSRRSSRMALEDKMRDASRYQDVMIGGPTSALTAEALKHVKHGTSSHSTRSTESRDESDYKHSATTHTTRSSSGEDDITIKVPVGAVVEVGGTKIHCRDGGDISLARPGPGRIVSDRGSSIYSEDRRSRSDRMLTGRTRASSQAAYPRALPAPSGYPPSRYGSSPFYDDDVYYDYDERYHPGGVM